MAEYIRREAVLKSLEYTTVWEAEAENVIALHPSCGAGKG